MGNKQIIKKKIILAVLSQNKVRITKTRSVILMETAQNKEGLINHPTIQNTHRGINQQKVTTNI